MIARAFPLVLCVCASIHACVDDSAAPPPAAIDSGIPLPDAGGLPGADGGPGPDAPGPDGAVSGKGIKITILDQGAAVPNVRVILHDAAGAILGDLKTDATGVASSAITAKQVTIIERASRFLTFTDIADGDELVFDAPVPVLPATYASYSVTLNAWTGAGTPSQYAVYPWGCGATGATAANTTNPFVVGMRANCPATNNAILAKASNGATVLGFRYQTDLPLPAMGTTEPTGLTGGWAAGKTATIKLVGAPGDVTTANGGVDLIVHSDLWGGLADFTGGVKAPTGEVYPMPSGFADEAFMQVTMSGAGSWMLGMMERKYTGLGPGMAGTGDISASFDYTAGAPRVAARAATVPVAGRPEATWSLESAYNAGCAWAKIGWTGGTWHFFMAGDRSTGIRAPELPADVTGVPMAGANATVNITFFKASAYPDHAAFKKIRFSDLSGSLTLKDLVPRSPSTAQTTGL